MGNAVGAQRLVASGRTALGRGLVARQPLDAKQCVVSVPLENALVISDEPMDGIRWGRWGRCSGDAYHGVSGVVGVGVGALQGPGGGYGSVGLGSRGRSHQVYLGLPPLSALHPNDKHPARSRQPPASEPHASPPLRHPLLPKPPPPVSLPSPVCSATAGRSAGRRCTEPCRHSCWSSCRVGRGVGMWVWGRG